MALCDAGFYRCKISSGAGFKVGGSVRNGALNSAAPYTGWFDLFYSLPGYFPIPIHMNQTGRTHLFDTDWQDIPCA